MAEPSSTADLMARVPPARVIFVLGWSSAAKDGILHKLTGSHGAQDERVFETDTLCYRIYAPVQPSDTSFIYVSLTNFSSTPLDDSSPSSSSSSSSSSILDLARLGSAAGILHLCGPSITDRDRTLLRFVQTFFGPASLAKVTVIFNLWAQCRDDAYVALRARLQGSATDPDIAAIRNPQQTQTQQQQFLGGKILTCAPRAAGDERVTNLAPIIRRRYGGDDGRPGGGEFAKLQFVREVEAGRAVENTEAARVLALGLPVRIVDGVARVVEVRRRGVGRTGTGGRVVGRESSEGGDSAQQAEETEETQEAQQKSPTPTTTTNEKEGGKSPNEFEPPTSPTPSVPTGQRQKQSSLFPALVAKQPSPVSMDAATTDDTPRTPTTTTTTKTTKKPRVLPDEETPLLSRPSTPSFSSGSLPSSGTTVSTTPTTTTDTTSNSNSTSTCLPPLLRLRRPTFAACLRLDTLNPKTLLHRPLSALGAALAATRAGVRRAGRAAWVALVEVPLVLVRAAVWMAVAVVVGVLVPREEGEEGGAGAGGVISSL